MSGDTGHLDGGVGSAHIMASSLDGLTGDEMAQRGMLSDITTSALAKGLDGAYARQLAISDNLANVETPNYQAKSVSFEASLRAALRAERSASGTGHDGGRIEDVRPYVRRSATMWRRDGNSVNIETEMVQMAKTSLHYRMLSRLMAKKFRMMARTLNGGGGQ
jgi:flagellar basal-body rod protein FlgB